MKLVSQIAAALFAGACASSVGHKEWPWAVFSALWVFIFIGDSICDAIKKRFKNPPIPDTLPNGEKK